MGAVLAFNHQLETTTCWNCGIDFAVPTHWINKRREDGKSFFCPNGHSACFGKSEVERLKAELEAQQRATNFQRDQRLLTEKHLIAQKAQTTKARNQLARTANGVCPCCNRTFQNVMRHMATKHSDFKKVAE